MFCTELFYGLNVGVSGDLGFYVEVSVVCYGL